MSDNAFLARLLHLHTFHLGTQSCHGYSIHTLKNNKKIKSP